MVHDVPEPSTPPRQLRNDTLPTTPATPRFGTFEDLPSMPQKQRLYQTYPEQTPRRSDRRPSQMATPGQTPKKRQLIATPSKTGRRVKRTIAHRSAKSQSETSVTPIQGIGGDNEEEHPHNAKPRGPGMWFVFRGKKIFRPLPPGEEPVKPVRLFPHAQDEKSGQSEEETDHEL